jgi:hypothetical protein
MASGSRVALPASVPRACEVYVNGVRQVEGVDFVRDGGELVFERRLAQEGRLGFWRWTSLFFGIAGTYRQNDSVDVVFDSGGRRVVATGLPITPTETGVEPVNRDTRRADAERGA